jgi:hypothetical protein
MSSSLLPTIDMVKNLAILDFEEPQKILYELTPPISPLINPSTMSFTSSSSGFSYVRSGEEVVELNSPSPKSYDYSVSTEENYRDNDAPFVGKYAEVRSQLDYTYHSKYNVNRQLQQDLIIDKFLETVIFDGHEVCTKPSHPWLVFTAGPMGVGKGHTVNWLNSKGLFPLQSFVNVDPDKKRHLLPEFPIYNKMNSLTAGYRTQKEVGYIAEVS